MLRPWRSIPTWCDGLNDAWSTCWWVLTGNWDLVHGGVLMPDVEIMNAARTMAGVNFRDHTTDRGEDMEVGLEWLRTRGWPGDPLLRAVEWARVPASQIITTVVHHGCAMAWCQPPEGGDEENLFADDMLSRAPGSAHGVLIVAAEAQGLWLISWGEAWRVSWPWWARFGRQAYRVVHPSE